MLAAVDVAAAVAIALNLSCCRQWLRLLQNVASLLPHSCHDDRKSKWNFSLSLVFNGEG